MRRLLRSAGALLAAVVVLRSAGFAFGILNIDESDYLIFGASLWRGEIPYRDLVEIKPPLGYLTYWPGGLFDTISIIPIRVLGVLWVFATALVLRAAARRWTRDEDVGWAAAWLSLLAGLCELPSFGSEVMMNLPVAAALYFWVRAQSEQRRAVDDVLCGICIGLASLYRHQGAIAAVAFGLVLIWQRRPARLSLLAVSVLAPWAAAAGAYAAIGQLPTFMEWAFARNLAYAGPGSAGHGLTRFASSTLICVSAALVPWALAARASFKPRDAGLALLLWLTWLPVSLGGRFYEHYYLQFVPPLALLAAPGAAVLARRFADPARRNQAARAAHPPSGLSSSDSGTPAHAPLSRRARAALILACVLPALGSLSYSYARGVAGRYPSQEPHTVELARWLREHTARPDRLFVWGHYTPIYALANRLPGTRYLNTSVHMGNFDPQHLPLGFDAAAHRSDRDVRATIEDLERRRPEWVVDTAPADIHGWSRVPLSAFPDLAGAIEENYLEVARPGGARVLKRRNASDGHPYTQMPGG